MESELRRKIQSRDRSKPLKPPEKDLYEAYKLMRGYGASDDDLFA
jgi:hypothetical protein